MFGTSLRREADWSDPVGARPVPRGGGAVERALAALGEAAAPYALEGAPRVSLMPLIIDAVRARATVGEISDTLSGRWGAYRPGI